MLLKTLWLLIGTMLISTASLFSQDIDTLKEQLPEIIVRAFENNRKLKDLPAAVNYAGKSVLEKFSPSSIVQAINTTPGIRMEERSPGSYRINIRGSSLRSPFGVRNVKVYFNNIPITDPGGHTYLNQFGNYSFSSIEIIKGPGSSLYGAGTGGVMLIESLHRQQQSKASGAYTTGSYGLQNVYANSTTASQKTTSQLSIQHQQGGGYRDHSKLKRNVFSWNGKFYFADSSMLQTTFLYGNLFYETPGALTKAEYDTNPKSARPGNGTFPGAETAQASISQKQFIAGASYTQRIMPQLDNTTTLYGMFTELRNPAIQNYGHNSEPHVGGRTVFKYRHILYAAALSVNAGAEYQRGFATVSIHKNAGGSADTLRTYDEINDVQALAFVQVSVDYKIWSLTTGSSLNFFKVKFQRFTPGTLGKQQRDFSNQLAPRVALLKKLGAINLYASIAKGFSPPTTSELVPTGGAINLGLNAEQGTNYDFGIKATFFKNLYVDINAFTFSLSNTIVQRRDAGGGNYFVNAGSTKQHGIETYISYSLLQRKFFMQRSNMWLSHTWHSFHYQTFTQLNNTFSGNPLPGEPQHSISTGFDFTMKNGFSGTASYYFSDKIFLNDEGSDYADAYHLAAMKIGYRKSFSSTLSVKLYAGVDNLFNQKFSLGNDVNGFGGRYYNAAAKRNYYAGLVIEFPISATIPH